MTLVMISKLTSIWPRPRGEKCRLLSRLAFQSERWSNRLTRRKLAPVLTVHDSSEQAGRALAVGRPGRHLASAGQIGRLARANS